MWGCGGKETVPVLTRERLSCMVMHTKRTTMQIMEQQRELQAKAAEAAREAAAGALAGAGAS